MSEFLLRMLRKSGQGSSSIKKMQPMFTTKKGYYTATELGYLSLSLGFPGNLLPQAFRDSPSPDAPAICEKLRHGKAIKERTVKELLELQQVRSKFDKTFNKHPAIENVKLFEKVMSILRHRSLSFKELSDARVAFELYACEAIDGIPAESTTLQQAFKMLDRIISPIRLESLIKRYTRHSESSIAFKMYEFLDLVCNCRKLESVEKEFEDVCLSVDFCSMFLTKEQRLLKYLDEQYEASFFKKAGHSSPTFASTAATSTSSAPSSSAKGKTIQNNARKSLTSVADAQARAIAPFIEQSQQQLARARSGHCIDFEYIGPGAEDLVAKREKTPQLRIRLRSTKNLRRKQTNGRETRNEQELTTRNEITSDIDRTCVQSVLRARSALKQSFACISSESESQSTPMDS